MSLYNKMFPRLDVLQEGGSGAGAAEPNASSPPSDGDSGTGAAGDAPEASAPKVDWTAIKQALPDDLRSDKSLSTINSIEGLVKSYVHSQKAIGNKVAIPDKHATAEDWQQFYRKVGVPEKFEEYDFNKPQDIEVDEGFVENFKKAGHEAGILPWQLEKIFNQYVDYVKNFSEGQQQELEARSTEDLESLKKEWGEAFDDRKRAANVAFQELLPNEADRKRLIEDGMASHPSVVRLLANASKLFKEDVFLGHGEGKLGGKTPDEALQEAREIQGNMQHPYRNPQHPNHKQAKEYVANLYKIAFPD